MECPGNTNGNTIAIPGVISGVTPGVIPEVICLRYYEKLAPWTPMPKAKFL